MKNDEAPRPWGKRAITLEQAQTIERLIRATFGINVLVSRSNSSQVANSAILYLDFCRRANRSVTDVEVPG